MIGGGDLWVMGTIELQSLPTGNRHLTSLQGKRGEGITWPDQVIGSVEKVGDVCSSLRFKQHDFNHGLLVEHSAFMRKSFGRYGDEFIMSR